MDNLDTPSTHATETTDLQEQYENLRHLVVSALVLLLILSGTFDLFLLRQVRFTSSDLAQARQQAAQVGAEYSKVSVVGIQEFVKKLLDYGKTHPDFAPIALKFHLNEVGRPPVSPAAGNPSVPAQPK